MLVGLSLRLRAACSCITLFLIALLLLPNAFAQETIAGVQGTVKRCNGNWCRLTGDGFDGWIEQSRLWGVYPNETIE